MYFVTETKGETEISASMTEPHRQTASNCGKSEEEPGLTAPRSEYREKGIKGLNDGPDPVGPSSAHLGPSPPGHRSRGVRKGNAGAQTRLN